MDNRWHITKLDNAELIILRLPLVTPFTTSFGTQTEREALLVKLTGDGAVGWGECVSSADPFYSSETNQTARHIIREHLLPRLQSESRQPISPEDLAARWETVRGHHMAKAAVENAFLDLVCRRENVPLFHALGGEEKRIPSGISIGIMPSSDDLLGAIHRAVETGYHRIKLKIKKGRDLEILREVRGAFPDINLMADANADYSHEDTPLLKKMDAFDLMMIEQPLAYDDIYFHSLVQKRIETPICLDESIKSLRDVQAAIELGSCRIINIKQGRVGGMLAARDIQAHCLRAGIPVWSGGMLETGIGRAFNLHLQTLPGFSLPGDTSETSRYFAADIAEPPVELDSEGFIPLPPGPGSGVRIVPDRLDRFTTHREIIDLSRP